MCARLMTTLGFLIATSAYAADYLPPSSPLPGGNRSPGIVTTAGKLVWLSGVGAEGENGQEQARKVFADLDSTLKQAGGSLRNLVQMTIYLRDESERDAILKVRDEMFEAGRYPATVLLIRSVLPMPGYRVYISGVGALE